LDFVADDQTKKKQLAHLLFLPMPSQSVAACASRQAILGKHASTLVSLNDAVNLPITREVAVSPATLVELHRVATEVTVTLGLHPNLSQFGSGHAPPF
jgi:hypothetical protein